MLSFDMCCKNEDIVQVALTSHHHIPASFETNPSCPECSGQPMTGGTAFCSSTVVRTCPTLLCGCDLGSLRQKDHDLYSICSFAVYVLYHILSKDASFA